MTAVTASMVKELRDRTGLAMMECKKALTEAGGDVELAIDNLRKSGQAKAVSHLFKKSVKTSKYVVRKLLKAKTLQFTNTVLKSVLLFLTLVMKLQVKAWQCTLLRSTQLL